MARLSKTNASSVKNSTICTVLIATLLVIGGFAVEELAVLPLEGQATPMYGTTPTPGAQVQSRKKNHKVRRPLKETIMRRGTKASARSSSSTRSKESWRFSCNKLQSCRIR